jgi:hypothetical protein
MSDPVEIIIVGDVVKALSLNQRLHFMQRHARTKDYKTRAWLAWVQAGHPRATGRVRLDFVVRRFRVVDPGAVHEAMKACVDGLRDQPGRPSLLPDDSAKWLQLGEIIFETGARWRGREEVVVRVWPVEKQP